MRIIYPNPATLNIHQTRLLKRKPIHFAPKNKIGVRGTSPYDLLALRMLLPLVALREALLSARVPTSGWGLGSHGHKANCSPCCVVVVLSLSRAWLFATPWTAARQASVSITNSRSSLRLMSIETVMTSSHLILCHPLLLTSIFPSIKVFSNELALRIRWPKCWSFSFHICASSEYSGLISFRVTWIDFLAVQGTLMSLLKGHISKESML